ncbi:4-(cytidine 5'-diphospho)-2-C-methyl-D-erythritol kinase [Piscinibacter sp.]|uniref:4-(cytidine 5'-diphospho)-2-C-methyl-D-erythritol kinase n=1 Tax=Piscinibacter sp. TaxID=1903157 RepID=UPI002C2A1A53|nr:4-(cytidine 5'-diphospho)-2-C-methyl-D-erythritol kinase [Albitalea sp.]HUG23208.1 4-(cytidine 5'-diphospho)-2-C-methyl-D-erythritol kinase [Albitalea sp.]
MKSIHDVAAPAKLNLFLHVVGRRADGYHLLQSAFVLIDWADTLHFERRDDGRLARHDLGAALPADDLCLRAARSLRAESGTGYGVDISIDKQVPSGAGMGGGSSDAASTLLALNRLWALDWPLSRLIALGLRLGADLPFFLGGRNAWVEGIGELLTPIDLPQQRFAVVKPAASLATEAIFKSPLLVRDTEAVIVAGFLADAGIGEAGIGEAGIGKLVQGWGRNDLQPPAQAECDEVAQAARWLEAQFGNSRMTGSGSAVFARVAAQAAETGAGSTPMATMPPDLPAGWVGRMCRSLGQHPLAGWARD